MLLGGGEATSCEKNQSQTTDCRGLEALDRAPKKKKNFQHSTAPSAPSSTCPPVTTPQQHQPQGTPSAPRRRPRAHRSCADRDAEPRWEHERTHTLGTDLVLRHVEVADRWGEVPRQRSGPKRPEAVPRHVELLESGREELREGFLLCSPCAPKGVAGEVQVDEGSGEDEGAAEAAGEGLRGGGVELVDRRLRCSSCVRRSRAGARALAPSPPSLFSHRSRCFRLEGRKGERAFTPAGFSILPLRLRPVSPSMRKLASTLAPASPISGTRARNPLISGLNHMVFAMKNPRAVTASSVPCRRLRSRSRGDMCASHWELSSTSTASKTLVPFGSSSSSLGTNKTACCPPPPSRPADRAAASAT
mmetsp:Transcript_7690/g.19266  ORF Transcript_7690/g.19266 Transcript_7690/m.19266 type:complete len:361 (-) Transcript_7690:95-1177(-)